MIAIATASTTATPRSHHSHFLLLGCRLAVGRVVGVFIIFISLTGRVKVYESGVLAGAGHGVGAGTGCTEGALGGATVDKVAGVGEEAESLAVAGGIGRFQVLVNGVGTADGDFGEGLAANSNDAVDGV